VTATDPRSAAATAYRALASRVIAAIGGARPASPAEVSHVGA
jgi:hypothetical protein